MPEDVRRLRLGAATVTIINAGDLHIPPSDLLNVSEETWSASEDTSFTQPQRLPTYSVHVALPAASVVVDPGFFDWPSDHRWVAPEYPPPPSLVERLRAVGIARESVTHVVITHAHHDHFSGGTFVSNGELVPTFPNAHHYLSRRDWEQPENQAALTGPDSNISRTLGVLFRHGLLELVDGDAVLSHGLQILSAPGESPGHQIVRVESEEQVLYCVGDLYHQEVEVKHPEWMPSWSDVKANLQSRRTLAERSQAERAILVATHIAPLGRLQPTATGSLWMPL